MYAHVASEAAHPGKLRVVLVEDNEVNQMVAKAVLAKHGHRVRVAANASVLSTLVPAAVCAGRLIDPSSRRPDERWRTELPPLPTATTTALALPLLRRYGYPTLARKVA